jgi:hypothetical protein
LEIAENIHYVQEEECGMEKGTEERNKDIHQYSIELTRSVQGLGCITSLQHLVD